MNPVRIRIAVSLLVISLFLFLFCGGEKISSYLSPILLPFQFVPALIRALTNPAVIFIIGLISIFVVTLIFGRVYCSFLCPLGIFQDIFIALSNKIGWRRKHSFQKPRDLLRYSILGLIIITVALGSMSLVNIFDPYSIFGRIITQFVLPFFLWIYNVVVNGMKYFHVYLYSKDTVPVVMSVLFVNFGFLILIVTLSLRHGRLYCNSICPVGTLLGLISRISFFKFAIDKAGCNACSGCVTVCKAGCIDTQNAVIDQSRCVGCFNCLCACPQSVVSYRSSVKNREGEAWSPARRGLIIGGVAAISSALFMFNSGIRNLLRPAHASAAQPITPPGSISRDHFTQACSACHLCVSVCPTKVLTPSFLDYGVSGLLQPLMNYPESFCEYECNLCGRVCPTGAILPLSMEEKQITQIGEVDLLKDKCVVYINHQNCGACVEVCPTKTITFVNRANILYPVVDNQYCIGCGACSKACPTDPKSIIVKPNPVHKKVVKSLTKDTPIQQKSAVPDAFPF